MIVHDTNSDCLQNNTDHLYIPRRKEIYILWNILRAHLWKSAFHARLPGHLRSLHMRLPQQSDTKRIQYMSHLVNYIKPRIQQLSSARFYNWLWWLYFQVSKVFFYFSPSSTCFSARNNYIQQIQMTRTPQFSPPAWIMIVQHWNQKHRNQ